jgi:hypothetical protein
MAPKHKSSGGSGLEMLKRSHHVLPLSEKVKVLNFISKVFRKNLLSMKL